MIESVEYSSQLLKKHMLYDSGIKYTDFINAVGKKTLNGYLKSALIDSKIVVIEDNLFNSFTINRLADARCLAGFFFESLLATIIKNDYFLKKELFEWTYKIETAEVLKYYGYTSYGDFLTYLDCISKGSFRTEIFYPNAYCTTSKNDIVFIIKNLNAHKNDSEICGFQVKAIQGHEKEEIIDKIRDGTYKNVVTLLKNDKGIHSYERCYEKIEKMVQKKELNIDEAENILNRIWYPEKLKIPQKYIDDVYTWFLHLVNTGVKANNSFIESTIISSLNSIAIAENSQSAITVYER